MNRRLLSAVSAAALSLSLAVSVQAQDLGLQQLQDSARISMGQLGMDTAVIETLTLEQLAEIETISSTTTDDVLKVQRIEGVIEGGDAGLAAGGATTAAGATGDVSAADLNETQVLADTVAQRLAQVGMGDVEVDSLTQEQLIQIQLIIDGSDNSDEQRAQVERILGE